MAIQRVLGGVGAALTCPCHSVPLVLLLGATAGSTWLGQHVPLVATTLGVLFLASLWLLLRPAREGAPAHGSSTTCGSAAIGAARTCASGPAAGGAARVPAGTPAGTPVRHDHVLQPS